MGKLIIFPTDTVYGIGCQIFDIDNIKKIYEIKSRDFSKPLACLCANLEQIEEIAVVDDNVRKIIKQFMPGALTIVLKSKQHVNDKIGYATIGVRIPNSKIALDILLENGPMLTTSVNESGRKPLNDYDEIYQEYNHVVDFIYDSNEVSSNISSTVISYIDHKLILIREGSIQFNQIKSLISV